MNTSPITPIPQRAPAAAAPIARANVPQAAGRLVTDAPTRAFHTLMALCFTGATLTAETEHWRALHVALGYALGGLLVLRVLYGFVGPRSANLALVFKKLSAAPAWLRAVLQAARNLNIREIPWQQTQNLALAATIVLILGVVVPLVLSGLGTYNEWDQAWGGEWLSEIHEFFGEFMLNLVLAHIALIVGLSLLRRKNQARRMVSGRIEGAGPDLIPHNRRWLAVLLVVATLAFVLWQGGFWPVPAA